MKSQYLFLLGLLLMFLSNCCDKNESYLSRINLQNQSLDTVYIQLDCFDKYEHNDLYIFTEQRSGYRSKDIKLAPAERIDIFISIDYQIEPVLLAKNIFESVSVQIGKEGVITTYLHNDHENKRNLFSEQAAWEAEQNTESYPMQFCSDVAHFKDYIFNIK